MWTTETPGKARTAMQIAMEEARVRKFAATVSSLKSLIEALKQIGRAWLEAIAKATKAISEFAEKFLAIQPARPYPGAVSFEKRGMRSLPSGAGFSPSFVIPAPGLSPRRRGHGSV